MSGSDEESTSDDDEEEAQKSLKRASNSSQEAPGSNLEITSDTTSSSRLNSQTATIATTKGISRSSPVSISTGP